MRWMFCLALTLAEMLGVASADARPAVFWFNDPVGPDETVLVTGADLNEVTGVSISPVGVAQSEEPRSLEILQVNSQSLKVVVPKDFAAGIYRVALESPQGAVSLRLNRPTVYWTQADAGETATPGGTIQVFGRNIVRRKEDARLVLSAETAAPVTLFLRAGDVWRGTFEIPKNLPPGDYRLRVSNGDGTDEDVVDAGRIRITAPVPDARPTFNVHDFGAVGNGTINATWPVKQALEAAERSGGGIVYFPRGRYLLNERIEIPPGVDIKGERTDLVNLAWPEMRNPPDALIVGLTRFSIEDLTIYTDNPGHVISGGFVGNTQAPAASDIAVRRVRIRASAFRGHLRAAETFARMQMLEQRFPDSPDTIRLSGDRLTVSDCDVTGSGRSLYLFKASNAVVSGNLLHNGRNGWYSITGSSRVIFENNVVAGADLQSTGGSINTLSKQVSGSENIYFGHNTFKDMQGWDREAFTTDGGGGYYFGPATSAAPDRLELLGPPNKEVASPIWTGAAVMVVDGRGAGEVARVARLDEGTAPTSVTLDRPLQVALDATSKITIAPMQQNYLIIDNLFEDAAVAQTFGTALNHVIAQNRSIRTAGFFVHALIYDHFQPAWQVQLLDNHIIEGTAYEGGPDRVIHFGEAAVAVQAARPPGQQATPPLVRAAIVRGNQLDEDAHIEVTGVQPAYPGVRDVVIEDNVIGASRAGIYVDRGTQWWIERRNVVKTILK